MPAGAGIAGDTCHNVLIVWGVFRLSSREKGEAADIVSVSQYAEVQRYAAG